MRLVGNARARRIGIAPMPLEICPGRQIWERHSNREYLIFVDESFYRFFGFADEDGNFCHSAVGVPSDAYARLQELLDSAVDAYRHHVQRSLGAVPNEIKFAEFRTLPIRFRAWFTRQVVDRLTELGGFAGNTLRFGEPIQ
jgi:hypothetical protein